MSIDYDKEMLESIEKMKKLRLYLKTHKISWKEKIKIVLNVARESSEKIKLALNDKDV